MVSLDGYATFVVASMVLLSGRVLVSAFRPLQVYSIPEPVVGGLIAALGVLLAQQIIGVEVRFDGKMGTPLMLCFFASIGLNADLVSLKRGGKPLLTLLVVVIGFLVAQNITGVVIAKLLGLDAMLGLIAGSITLSGGHGTGAAWAAVFNDKYGLSSATELALACATFGLILGGVIGGPVAKYLSGRLKETGEANADLSTSTFEKPAEARQITSPEMIETLALFSICLLGGTNVAALLQGSMFELPSFVCVLFIGIVLRNTLSALGWYKIFDRCVSVLGNVSLALFLAMALMSLRLWELASVALPMFVLLGCQAALMAGWAIFVTFRAMGGNYDAMVIAAGHCGFGLGATPTAIANMQAVTDHFRPSHLAFLVVPMVGAFFIDIANALVIKVFLAILG